MNPKHLALVGLLVAAAAWTAYNRFSSSGALAYTGGWEESLKRARAEGKPILLNFGGPW